MGKDIASGMRHKITFQSESLTPDSGGGSTVGWTNVTTVWASIDTFAGLTGRSLGAEGVFAGQLQAKAPYRFTTRYVSGITPKMRILFGSRTFNIRSVINVGERDALLEIFAEEGGAV